MARLSDGSRIGSFVIERFIGQGQFGITYKAKHDRLGFAVAIKEFFPRDLCFRSHDGTIDVPDNTQSHEFEAEKKSFLSEARTLAPFRDTANISNIIDIIECHNTSYIIMDYVDGWSVWQSVREKKFNISSPEYVELFLDRMLRALSTLHAQIPPILHRDIKPGNIVVSSGDLEPHLIDFGAARQASARNSQKLTTILTKGYAPYEQYVLSDEEIENEFGEIDQDGVENLPIQGAYTDLYALGATCHFILTGKPPPDGFLRKLGAQKYQPLSLAPSMGAYNRRLIEAIDIALAVEPRDRFQSAAEWLRQISPQPRMHKAASTAIDDIEADQNKGTEHSQARADTEWASDVAYSAEPRVLEDGPSSGLTVDLPAEPSPPKDGEEGRGHFPHVAAIGIITVATAIGLSIALFRHGDNPTSAAKFGGLEDQIETASSPKMPSGDSKRFQDCPVCPMMATIPDGKLLMGSDLDEVGRHDDEGPRRLIQFGNSFALSETEVTRSQWQACVSDNECQEEPLKTVAAGLSHPVTMITWYDAKNFTNWLSRKTGKEYRLPSEAEWEYSALAQIHPEKQASFSWGQSRHDAPANCKECNALARNGTLPVKSYVSNNFNLYDMHGNVWEWTGDCYFESLEGVPDDGKTLDMPRCDKRVIKGGGYANPLSEARAARRLGIHPNDGGDSLGFRVAVSLKDQSD